MSLDLIKEARQVPLAWVSWLSRRSSCSSEWLAESALQMRPQITSPSPMLAKVTSLSAGVAARKTARASAAASSIMFEFARSSWRVLLSFSASKRFLMLRHGMWQRLMFSTVVTVLVSIYAVSRVHLPLLSWPASRFMIFTWWSLER